MQLRSDVTTAHTLMQSAATDGLESPCLACVATPLAKTERVKSIKSILRTGELVDAVSRDPAANVNLERRHVILGAVQRERCRTRGVAGRVDWNRWRGREEAPWSCAKVAVPARQDAQQEQRGGNARQHAHPGLRAPTVMSRGPPRRARRAAPAHAARVL